MEFQSLKIYMFSHFQLKLMGIHFKPTNDKRVSIDDFYVHALFGLIYMSAMLFSALVAIKCDMITGGLDHTTLTIDDYDLIVHILNIIY